MRRARAAPLLPLLRARASHVTVPLLLLLLLLLLAALPAARGAGPSYASRLTPAQRHHRRPDLAGREYVPHYGHKNQTVEDHGGDDMYLQRVATLAKTDPLAVCNDGSGAALYIRKGSDVGTWLLYLQGGEWCWSEASCALRQQQAPWLMSNTGKQLEPPAAWMGGAFERNTKRNPLGDVNVAYAPYCSSDAWVGNAPASNATFGWHFMGQRIFAAAVKAVVAAGLGASAVAASERGLPPPTLIVGGCSAGSRGAMMNLDYVPGILEEAGVAAGLVTVVGLLDSPLWVDIEPLEPSIVSLQEQSQAIYEVINATARLGDACMALYPTELWRCLFGEYRAPTLQTRYLMSASQDDRFQLSWNIAGNGSLGSTPGDWKEPELQYANMFTTSMRSVIESLPTPSQFAAGSMVFSTACFHHCTTQSAAFWNVAISPSTLSVWPLSAADAVNTGPEPVSLRDALQLWLWPAAGAPAAPQRIMQKCTGFRCGQCTTKLKNALAQGLTLPTPPPPPPMPPTPPATPAGSALQKRHSEERTSVAAMLAFAAVVGMMLGFAAREATRRVADSSNPYTGDAPESAFSLPPLHPGRHLRVPAGIYTTPGLVFAQSSRTGAGMDL